MRESITTLPTEVIEEIISYISYSDITALAQTSKRLWLVATPRLLSVIPLLTSQKIRRYIQRLADDPQRAAQTLEIHLPHLLPREERRKPSPWRFDTVSGFLITSLERVVPLPFVPVETYPELGRIFTSALQNMTHLRTLTVHSRQHGEIWDNYLVIPSLREIFVYPDAESPYLWHWTMRQHNIMTLRNCWHGARLSSWWSPSPPACGPTAFSNLQTLITDPVGVAVLIHKSIVSDLVIHGLPYVHPDQIMSFHPAQDIPPYLHKVCCSNKRTPLRRIALSGPLDRICYILQVLQSRDSLPPHVRLFFELEDGQSEQDLLGHPQLDQTIRELAILDILEVYKNVTGPDYPDPEVELAIETASIEEAKVHVWASSCILLRVIRFPSNSKWAVHRENGKLFPRMVLQ